jgi:hypothetical protein
VLAASIALSFSLDMPSTKRGDDGKKRPAVERSYMKKPKCLCASARKKSVQGLIFPIVSSKIMLSRRDSTDLV